MRWKDYLLRNLIKSIKSIGEKSAEEIMVVIEKHLEVENDEASSCKIRSRSIRLRHGACLYKI